jgi:hypothetical protein
MAEHIFEGKQHLTRKTKTRDTLRASRQYVDVKVQALGKSAIFGRRGLDDWLRGFCTCDKPTPLRTAAAQSRACLGRRRRGAHRSLPGRLWPFEPSLRFPRSCLYYPLPRPPAVSPSLVCPLPISRRRRGLRVWLGVGRRHFISTLVDDVPPPSPSSRVWLAGGCCCWPIPCHDLVVVCPQSM